MRNQKTAYRFVPVWLFAALLFAGCGSEDVSSESANGVTVPLTINELHLEGELATRVSTGTVTTDGAIIKVFQLATNGYMGEYNVKCTYTTSDGTSQWKLAKFIGIDKRSSSIVGVYDPNGLGVFPDGKISTETSVNLTVQLFDEAQLWYLDTSHNAVTNASPAVAFKMAPAYSRMVLQIERDATYLSDCKITEVTLTSSGNFFNNLPLDISKGELNGNSIAYNAASNPLLTNANGFVTIASSSTESIDLLLPPQTITSSGLTVSLKIDGEVRSVTIPNSSLGNLASGSQYIVPLKIVGPATLTISSGVTEQAWGTTFNMGTVTDTSGMS